MVSGEIAFCIFVRLINEGKCQKPCMRAQEDVLGGFIGSVGESCPIRIDLCIIHMCERFWVADYIIGDGFVLFWPR